MTPVTSTGAFVRPVAILVLVTAASGLVRAQTELPEVLITAPTPVQPPLPTQNISPIGNASEDLRPIAERVFAPVTIIPEAQIQRTPAATIGDIVAGAPGVAGSTFAPGANRPIIRGVDNARIRLQENGLGSMDVSDIGEDHGVPIDPLSANRVEVIRGPATLRWGSQAIGGVVSVDNNRIPVPETPMGLRAIMRNAFTTVDNGRESAVIIDGRNGAFATHIDIFKRIAEDYRTPLGTQRNTQIDMKGISTGTSYIFQNGYFGASLTHFASDYGVPGIEAGANKTHIDLRQTKFNSKGELRIGSAYIDTIRYWFGASLYQHDERGLNLGVDSILATFKNREYEGRVETQLQPMAIGTARLQTAIGLQFGNQRLGTSGEAGGLLPPTQTERTAVYIFNELHLSQAARIQVAGRIEKVSVRGAETVFPANFLPNGLPLPETARGRTFAPISISAGFLHDMPFGTIASITVQRVERAPTALELFSRGAHEASGTFEIGNANLKTERAQSIEASLRKARGPFQFDATVFHTQYRGYISKRLTGALCGEDFDTCGVDTEFKQIVYTQRNATFTGAEFSTRFDIAPLGSGTFGVENQFDIVRARFSDGTNIPRIPPMRIGGGLFWYSSGFFTRVNWLHAFAQSRMNAAEETPTKGYNMLKAEISYRHKWKFQGIERELTVGVAGTNLLNENIRNHTSFKKDEVLQPGRNFKLFANLHF